MFTKSTDFLFVLNGEQSLTDIFIKKFLSEPAEKKYDTKKSVVNHIDNTWILNLLCKTDYVKTAI